MTVADRAKMDSEVQSIQNVQVQLIVYTERVHHVFTIWSSSWSVPVTDEGAGRVSPGPSWSTGWEGSRDCSTSSLNTGQSLSERVDVCVHVQDV